MRDLADGDLWGICNVCKGRVLWGDRQAHGVGCPGFYVSYDWATIANPHNTPWVPGYRFGLRQGSQRVARTLKMRPREYWVGFQVDADGLLQWNGGVKPTDATWERARAAYARGRPGSNGAPDRDLSW